MQEISANELFQKLASIGALLGAFTMSAELGPSTLPKARVAVWQVYDASTYATTQSKPTTAELELALAEVRTARAVLAQTELRREEAFGAYLTTLDAALDSYEHAGQHAVGREIRLATALAVARTVLQDSVRSVSSWLALVRSAGTDERYVTVPERFVTSEVAALTHDEGLDDRSLVTWLDLDSAEV